MPNCPSPVCRCRLEDENTVDYLFGCPLHSGQRIALLDNVSKIVGTEVNVLPDDHLLHALLYVSNVYNKICNKLIINERIKSIKKSQRFDDLGAFQIVFVFFTDCISTSLPQWILGYLIYRMCGP